MFPPYQSRYYHEYECFCGRKKTTQSGTSKSSEYIRCGCGGKMFPRGVASQQRKLAELYSNQ